MLNRTVAALLGALLMIGFGVLSYSDIGSVIDYKVLTLALGMMIVVNVVNQSGFFEYVSIKAIKFTKGDPIKILVILSLLALIFTAFLDNITTALILGSFIITACTILGLDFVPYLIAISIVINIGGILTPIASLPNMMVSSAAGFGFMSFTWYLLPLCIVLIVVTLTYLILRFRKDFAKRVRLTSKAELDSLEEGAVIKDKKLFVNSIVMLGAVILAFLFHEHFGWSLEVIALAGAIIMLLLSGASPEKVFTEVHWSTLAFLFGIFIIVGAVEKVGLLAMFSAKLASFIHVELGATLTMLVASTTATAFVNNIPVTAVFIPVARDLASSLAIDPTNLFYALVVAAGLGGNLTPIGSPSSIIASGLAERHGGSVSFVDFLEVGFFLTLIHLAIAVVYFVIRAGVL